MRLWLVLPLVLWVGWLGGPGSPVRRAAAAGSVVQAEPDPCGPQERDPTRLAQAGLRIYQEAVRTASRDPQAAVRKYEVALRCYRAVTQVSHEPAKIFHPMGLVYLRLGRYTEAFSAFKRFLAEVPEDKRKPGVTKQIQDRLLELKAQVAELTIDTVSDLQVRVDDNDVGRSPLPRTVPVTPGAHTVIVGDPERGTLGADITVRAGEVRRVDLTAWRPRARPTEPTPDEGTPVVQGSPVQREPGSAAPRTALLSVRANREGAVVRLDGATLGNTPLQRIPVAPGDHKLLATLGPAELQQALRLMPGEARQVDLVFPSRVRPWVIAVSVVAGVAVVGTAVGLGVYFSQNSSGPDRVLRF